MEVVLITSLSTGGGEDRLTQNTTLNFSKVKLLKQGHPDEGLEDPFQVVRDNPVNAIMIIPQLLLQNLDFRSWDGKLTKSVVHLAIFSNGSLATLIFIQKVWIQGRLGVAA